MSQPNGPSEKGFKPGANMPHDGYDPAREGMSESGNHAVGHPGNDVPRVSDVPHDVPGASEQHGRQPARSDQNLRQGNLGRSYQDSKQDTATASGEATHRDHVADARIHKGYDNKR